MCKIISSCALLVAAAALVGLPVAVDVQGSPYQGAHSTNLLQNSNN